MVIFQAPGGSPGYNQFETLDAAVGFVEQLRNERDVSNARIFALEEVKFEMRPYFKVELQALTRSTGQDSDAGSIEAPSPEPPRSAPEQSSPSLQSQQTPASTGPAPSAPAAPSAPPSTPPQAPLAPSAPSQTAGPTGPGPSQGTAPGANGDPKPGQPARRGLFGR
jgi:hypothetical protein